MKIEKLRKHLKAGIDVKREGRRIVATGAGLTYRLSPGRRDEREAAEYLNSKIPAVTIPRQP
jgi:hypothetical protein